MNLLNEWLPEQLLSALGWTLVHSLWQMVLVAGLLWLGLKLFKSKGPAFNYNLSLGAMGLTVLLVIVTFIYQVQDGVTQTTLFANFQSDLQDSAPLVGAETTTFQSLIGQATNLIESNIPLLVNFWFFGAILFMFRLTANLAAIRNLRQVSDPVEDFELEKSFYRLLGKLDLPSHIQLRIGQQGTSPMTFGFLKPVVLIPAALILHLSPAQLEAILAHELAHVKRQDYLINMIQSSLEVVFFYHPSFWWMSQTIKELRENAADDMVVKSGISPDVLAYGLAEVLNFAKQPTTDLALTASRKRNPTLQRIKRILGHPAQTYPQNPIISIPMLVTLLLSAGLMASAQQDVPVILENVKPLVVIEIKEKIDEVLEIHEQIDLNLDLNTDVELLIDTVIEQNVIAERLVSEVQDVKKDNVFVYDMEGVENEFDLATKFTFFTSGDTLISGKDTIIFSGKNSFNFESGPNFDFETMPTLELPDAPEFDIDFGPMPAMGAMPPMPPLEMEQGMFEFDGMDMGYFVMSDTTLTEKEREEWIKEMEEKSAKWAEKMEQNAAKWEKEMGPKMKEFEEKMKAWQEANEPKMKALQEKMEEWQKAQEPKMKEFQEKMKAWQEEQQPKMEEFQRKMEIWQKENGAKMEELVEKLQQEAEQAQKEAVKLQKEAKENNN